jgi:hypothetical protein
MLQPHAHHVLWFLGTFIALWSCSLIARGLLHRPRVGRSARGPRKVKKAAVVAGCVGFPIGVAFYVAGSFLRSWIYGDQQTTDQLTAFHAMAAGILAFAIALGAWGLFSDRARGSLRCPKCWYDMAGAPTTGNFICPECGQDAKDQAGLQRTRRHPKLVILAVLIGFVALLVPRFGHVQAGGVKALLPTTLMIPLGPHLPDDWVANSNYEDEWTLEERLYESRSWEWQRGWYVSRLQSEIRSPKSLERLRWALKRIGSVEGVGQATVTVETYTFVARKLGDPDPVVRLHAAELLNVGIIDNGWNVADGWAGFEAIRKAAAPQIATYADEIAPGLTDQQPSVVIETATALLEAQTREDKATQTLLALYPTLTARSDLMSATLLLIDRGSAEPRALEPLLQTLDKPDVEITNSVWLACIFATADGPLPPLIRDRLDLEIREGTDPRRVYIAARARLSLKASDSEIARLIERTAAEPGPRRAPALKACFNARAPGQPARVHLLAGAFEDPAADVLVEAINWAEALAYAREPGYERYLVDIEPLVGHRDEDVRTLAASAIVNIRNCLEGDLQVQREAQEEAQRQAEMNGPPTSAQ